MRLIQSSFLTLFLIGCGAGQVDYYEPPPVEPYCTYDIKDVCIHEYSYSEHSFCTYDVGGICVWLQSRFIEVDLDFLVDSILITETYTNGFYYGLNLFDLALTEGLRLEYYHAGNNTYGGTYGFLEAKVWVRQGSNITRRMTCMDTYHTAMHELMHFIDDKFIMCEDQSFGGHNVPNLFMEWETRQHIAEDRQYIQSNTIEGLTYFNLSNRCGYEE